MILVVKHVDFCLRLKDLFISFESGVDKNWGPFNKITTLCQPNICQFSGLYVHSWLKLVVPGVLDAAKAKKLSLEFMQLSQGGFIRIFFFLIFLSFRFLSDSTTGIPRFPRLRFPQFSIQCSFQFYPIYLGKTPFGILLPFV